MRDIEGGRTSDGGPIGMTPCEVTQSLPTADQSSFLYLACAQPGQTGTPLFSWQNGELQMAAVVVIDPRIDVGTRDGSRFVVPAMEIGGAAKAASAR